MVTAICVPERIAPDGLLFDSAVHAIPRGRISTGRVVGFEAMRNRIEDFIAWASGLAVDLERPHEVIPDDPFGAIGVARFRRSPAWRIARRPGRLVALATQCGHMRTAMSAGYAARGRGGIHELLDIETARATADTPPPSTTASPPEAGSQGQRPGERSTPLPKPPPSPDPSARTARPGTSWATRP
ncbi:hypothetical protein ACIQNI_32105 [Streptomyces sp. NPDC091266]|uniref:hypothetical protein n=1 Tax=Streptomyces sp. NPDC091266 TaxID=3365978 RepID=UPI003801996E